MDSEVITGLEDLTMQLTRLAPNIQKKLLRGALRAGQVVIANMAKDKVPVSPPSAENARLYGTTAGALRDSIRVSSRLRGTNVVATTKAGNKIAYYAHFVEFGTAAHAISAANGGALSFGGRMVDSLQHPGAVAHPFMRPALDWAATNESAPFRAVAAYLAPKLEQNLALLPDETDTKA